MLRSHLLLALLVVAPFGATPAAVHRSASELAAETEQAAVREFTRLVNKYVELHRRLATPLGPREMQSDPQQIRRAVEQLASAIRAHRPTAKKGDLFTPAVASFFRSHIAAVLRETESDVEVFLEAMNGDEIDEAGFIEVPPPVVNAAFPWAAGHLVWPATLLKLPQLPEEVEYRFVGRHLVLLDLRAHLVVDALENALPAPSPKGEPLGPCIAHPELDACWT